MPASSSTFTVYEICEGGGGDYQVIPSREYQACSIFVSARIIFQSSLPLCFRSYSVSVLFTYSGLLCSHHACRGASATRECIGRCVAERRGVARARVGAHVVQRCAG